ncbi:MAG: hypothetical protein ACI4F4_02940 [Lachnospiraceae bacterium]
MRIRRKKLIVLMMVLGTSCLWGCGSSNEPETITTEITTEATTQEIAYGDAGENAYEIYVTNRMGADITLLALTNDNGDGNNILDAAVEFGADEKVKCYFDKVNNASKLKVQLSDGEEYELSEVDMSDMDEVTLCYENEVAFIVYTSKATGEEVKTKVKELEIKKMKSEVAAFVEELNALQDDDENLEDAVAKLRETYDAFLDEQKAMVEEKDVQRLEELESLMASRKKKSSVPATTPAPTSAPTEQTGGGCLDDVLINEW